MSPASVTVTLRSVISCRGPERSTCSTRTSALPYWAGPSITWGGSWGMALGHFSQIHAVASGRRRDGSQGGGGANSGTIGDDDNAARRPSGGRAAGWRSARHALTPSVGGIAERRQQQWDVVMLARPGGEDDRDLREEGLAVAGHQVVPHGEDESGGGRDIGVKRGQVGAAAVRAGHRAAGRDPSAAGPDVEGDR